MALSGQFPVASVYRVEVSGWDSEDRFFVEKTEIAWDESDAKRLRLRRPLRKGSVVYVRLLQATTPVQSYPIAYRANPVGDTGSGTWEFRLVQVYPRAREGELRVH